VRVYSSPFVKGPAATGFLVRRIFVPSSFEHDFAPEEQRLALAHEELHHRRNDLWANSAALVVLAIHWYNPLAHIANRAFRHDLEAACDATLIHECGGHVRQLYARTILRCVAQTTPHPTCALNHIDELKGRLEMLRLQHGRTRRIAGTSIAAVLAASGFALGLPAEAKELPAVAEAVTAGATPFKIKFAATDAKAVEKTVKFAVQSGTERKSNAERVAARESLKANLIEVRSVNKSASCDDASADVLANLTMVVPAKSAVPEGNPTAEAPQTILCVKSKGSEPAASNLIRVLSRIEGTIDMPAGNKR
jgi:hypothetical protein